MTRFRGFATGRSAVRPERRSSNFDLTDPGIFARVVFGHMPADPEQTGALDPTSMHPAGLSPFGLVLAAELELTEVPLAALRFPLEQLPVAWMALRRALPPAPDLRAVSMACPTLDKSARRQSIFRTTDASLPPRLAEPGGGGQSNFVTR